MKDNRGRPKEAQEPWVKREMKTSRLGVDVKYKFDRSIHPTATISTEIKGLGINKPKIDPKQKYTNDPVVVVFKTSNRSNAQTKMKVFKNKNVDDVITNKQAGIPENAVWLNVGVGESFIEEYRLKHKL